MTNIYQYIYTINQGPFHQDLRGERLNFRRLEVKGIFTADVRQLGLGRPRCEPVKLVQRGGGGVLVKYPSRLSNPQLLRRQRGQEAIGSKKKTVKNAEVKHVC